MPLNDLWPPGQAPLSPIPGPTYLGDPPPFIPPVPPAPDPHLEMLALLRSIDAKLGELIDIASALKDLP